MINEVALLESRSLRASVADRTDVLARVKALSLLPDGMHVTTAMVAVYFEVSEYVIRKLTQRHRDELTQNGMRTLHGKELESFKRDIMSLYPSPHPQPRAASRCTPGAPS
ncbi:hypothetical protein GCM10020367_32840 [Streptomyces sannanensis]|uniref:Helix-turn-helix domain-containing protein n=1 Tax=Streptomyces sannanensis TaxID=285536 RepID=A0ABP6SCR5_9ACTN